MGRGTYVGFEQLLTILLKKTKNARELSPKVPHELNYSYKNKQSNKIQYTSGTT